MDLKGPSLRRSSQDCTELVLTVEGPQSERVKCQSGAGLHCAAGCLTSAREGATYSEWLDPAQNGRSNADNLALSSAQQGSAGA